MKWIGVIVVLLVAPVLWLRGGLFQEPLSTVMTAAKMEVSFRSIAMISREPTVILMKSAALDDLIAAQAEEGWEFAEQLGSAFVFKRESGGTRMLDCRGWSSRYRICTAGPTES